MTGKLLAPKLTINLFGEGKTLYRIILSEQQIEAFGAIASRLKTTLAQALNNPFFYYYLKDARIKSVADLYPTAIYSGLLDTPKSQIEIWHGGRKILKLKMHELLNDMVLFPLYQIIQRDCAINENGFYMEQHEVGLLKKYETYQQHFRIDFLEFEIGNIKDQQILVGLIYNHELLKSSKKDTLITYEIGYVL